MSKTTFHKHFKNKTLLITGGTGSFGKALLKNLCDKDLKEIRVFSRDEKKQEDLRIKFNKNNIKFYLGDVRDYHSVCKVMSDVDFVFHAAALKQVPSCEFYPSEAIKTNVLGTENVINAAKEFDIKKLVVLSTDKAVYPINSMGLTKAMAEKIMFANARLNSKNSNILCATRYGNVMASRGSVIPLFVNQIKDNKPITLTDPNMTRFLMSLEDSVKLVMFAFINANQGDLFIQKAPAAKMKDLAKALMQIFRSNIEPVIIGTRHGEKLFETLVSREEMVRAEDMGDFYRIPNDNRDLNYDDYFILGNRNISDSIDYTSHNTKQLNVDEIKEILLNLPFIKQNLND